MLWKRSAIERLHAAHPELTYIWSNSNGPGERRAIGIFNEFIAPDGRLMTEDWALCARGR
jgi:hypothetical protein